jgi:hypothetical protein
LRVNICSPQTHKIATYWVSACIGIHAFAMRCEEEERGGDDLDSDNPDPFIAEGLSSDSGSSDAEAALGRQEGGGEKFSQKKKTIGITLIVP